MGNLWNKPAQDQLLNTWMNSYDVYAPMLFSGDGCFSDTDVVRYGKISSFDQIVWDKKSDYSFKEALLPISETMMYFTDTTSSVPEKTKGRIIFLRSCELNALKRIDDIYMNNGPADFYYQRNRENTKFILMGCDHSFTSCFCASMGTNTCEGYQGYAHMSGDDLYLAIEDAELLDGADTSACPEANEEIQYVKENDVKVDVPDKLPADIASNDLWKEYAGRCIGCGRCNFVCPTCTCFTTQDIFYRDNDHKNADIHAFPEGLQP
ncbi:MAG: anaerobic sulfite reductase subunit A, partial [Clostridia bacterium]|nr:anaerobic sulfite reductase subunit A [Clostridia bacterium]